MKHILITTIAVVLVVGWATMQSPEPPTGKAPDISIVDATKEGNIKSIKQHLAAGADVNAKTESGWTPLHEATDWRHEEIVELLIAAGADVNAENVDGYTPLGHAERHPEIADLLRKHGGKTKKELEAAGN